jgi:hypothetical protein
LRNRLSGVAAALIGLGGAVGERVEAPVHIGVFMPESMIHPVQHLHRLLRRCAAIEIDQPVPMDNLGEDREIGTDFGEIEGHCFSS